MVVGGTGEGVQVKGGAGVRAPRWGTGAKLRGGGGGLSLNELKMFHKQILSRNDA